MHFGLLSLLESHIPSFPTVSLHVRILLLINSDEEMNEQMKPLLPLIFSVAPMEIWLL